MPTMTTAQRREQDRAAYNAYVAACPSRQVLDALSDKWVTLVLTALSGAPRRYSELSRTITPSVPVRVDYELTSLGRTLLPVVRAIKDWSESHIAEIHTARSAYDRAARP